MMSSVEITTLKEKPHLRSEVLSLIEDAFNYSPPYRFATDFYPLVKKSNYKNLHILLENNTVAAHVGFLPKMLTFRQTHFPVALIGGVATAKDKRGKGYFDRLMQKIVKDSSPYMGHLLWGNLERLYKKYHFHPMGVLREQKSHCSALPSGYTPTLYKDLDLSQKNQLKKIYNLNIQNFAYLQRDWNDIEKITSGELYIKQDGRSKMTNYFFLGKGQDLPGIIHEALGLPGHPNHLAHHSCWMPDTSPFSHLPALYGCLFRISNPHLFKKFITLYTGNALSLNTVQNDLLTFEWDKQTTSLAPADFLSGLFGPHFIEEFRPFYSPLWIGGLDSV